MRKNLNTKSLPKAKKGITIYPGGKQPTPTGQSNAFSNNPAGLTPEQLLAAGKQYGFRTDNAYNFQEDMYKYIASNKPELMNQMVQKYGPAKAGMIDYGGVKGFAPDGMLGARSAAMFQQLGPAKPQKKVRFEKLHSPDYWKDTQGGHKDQNYYSPVYEGAWSEKDIQRHQANLPTQASDGTPYFIGDPWRQSMQKKGPDSRSWASVNGTPMQQLGKPASVPVVPVTYPQSIPQPLPQPTDPRVQQDAKGNQFVRMGPAQPVITKAKYTTGGPFGEPVDPLFQGQNNPFAYSNPGSETPQVPGNYLSTVQSAGNNMVSHPAANNPNRPDMVQIGQVADMTQQLIGAGTAAFDYIGKQRLKREQDAWGNGKTSTDGIYGDGMATSRGDYTQSGQFRPAQKGNFSFQGMYAEGGSTMPEVGMPAILHEEAITGNTQPFMMPAIGPAMAPVTQGSAPVKPMKNVDVGKTAQYAYDFYLQKGLPQHVAAGIVGNLVAESGMNPTIKGDGGKATGLAQWHPDRFQKLIKWASSQGLDPYNIDTQLHYVYHEANQRGDLNKTMATKNSADAAVTFGRSFERPSERYANWGKRAGVAQKLAGYKKGGEYEMTETEIKQFLELGGEIEYLD